MRLRNIALAGAMGLAFGNAQATLFDRGGGLLYDDVLNVTWLQDANYAKTSGYDADGLISWDQANTWAQNLSFVDTVRNVTYSDWRLASNTPIHGSSWQGYFMDLQWDGNSDYGYNITSPASEMSYMYYVNLGLKGYRSTGGGYQTDFGVFGNGAFGGQKDVGLVKNLQAYVYWSGTLDRPFSSSYPWIFSPASGLQTQYTAQPEQLYAWAVRDGDVAAIAAPIPEPETYAMLLAGLGLLGVMTRRRAQLII
jgi:hypothetical protein